MNNIPSRDVQTNLDLLVFTMQSINKAKDFQIISDIIFKFIDNLVSVNMAVIYKYNQKENILEVMSCIGSNPDKMRKRIPFKIGEGAIGLAARDKRALLIADVLESKDIRVRQFRGDPLIRSFMAIPLLVGNKVIGILSVSCSKPNQYTDYDVKIISILASQAAAFLELNKYISDIEKMSDQILENVNSGVMVVDNQLYIKVFNDAAEKISGYTKDEILGKSLDKLFLKEEDKDHFIINFIIRSIEEHKTFNEVKTHMVKKDGGIIKVRLSTSLLYDEDNMVKSCICIFRDVTEWEELQRQVMLTDKLSALGRLTAGITHEIRNPLLSIRNASQYIYNKLKKNNDNEDIIKLINIITEESDRLNRFLGQLANLSKDNIVTDGVCNFNEVLDNILLLLNYNLRNSRIDLKLDLGCNKIIIACNEDNLRQVLLNILLNAIDALNNDHVPNKEIRIKGRVEDQHFHLTIEDTGKGISKMDLNNVFDPFFTTKENGTGLGLPLTLNIVDSIGGKIKISSTINLGTKVYLTLPIVGEGMS